MLTSPSDATGDRWPVLPRIGFRLAVAAPGVAQVSTIEQPKKRATNPIEGPISTQVVHRPHRLHIVLSRRSDRREL